MWEFWTKEYLYATDIKTWFVIMLYMYIICSNMHAKLFAKQACQLPRYYFYFDIISKHYTYIY